MSAAATPAAIAAARRLAEASDARDRRLGRLTRLAADLFQAPRAGLALLGEEQVWTRGLAGIEAEAEVPRAGTLIDRLAGLAAPLLVPDRLQDPRYADVNVDARFFAAAPICDAANQSVGCLMVVDPAPRSSADGPALERLADLAALASDLLQADAEQKERAAAERLELQRQALDQERQELALEAAGLGEFEWSVEDERLSVSPRLRRLLGVDEGDSPFRHDVGSALSVVHPDDLEAVRAGVQAAMKGGGRYRVQARIVQPGDGQYRWFDIAGTVAPADGGGGRAVKVIGVMRDITQERMADRQRETLLAELDHRVKNVLATVQSLAAQSARRATSLEGFLRPFEGRLKAMASAHELLTATRWRGAAAPYLAAAELGGLAPGQTRWEGPDVSLTPRAANALSLALHELSANAVKYGALSSERGRVDLRWRRTEAGGLEFVWSESGGPAVQAPGRKGFGLTLLERVTGRELQGAVTVEFRPTGVRAVLEAGPEALTENEGTERAPPRPAPAALEPPASEAAPAAAAPEPPAAAPTAPPAASAGSVQGLRILIVEDAVLLALELEAGLTDAGATVVGVAAEVGEALAMLSRPFDVAVLDANLNGASVQPVAAALAARGTPFIFATGYGDKRGPPGEFSVPVVRKPYHVRQIAAAVAEVTGRG